MNCLPQVKTRIRRFSTLALLGVALALGLPEAVEARENAPDAREILALVRDNQSAQDRDFAGRLRTSSSSKKVVVPFRLMMKGGRITYLFDHPKEAFVLKLGDSGARLEHVAGSGRTASVPKARYDEPVRGTDITYEDLALQFLYWNNAKVVGEDTLSTRRCWVVEAVPPGRGVSQYDRVRLWVEKGGALMKAECFQGGRLARRFEVRNVQKAPEGGGYILKSMRIQRMDGEGDRSQTYLDVQPL
ncbi:MAG TPA: outer membrane lipoprotein-sorting protein [Chthoniobacteraceae bacterium]|nr:outer membrane lipoprotein-sorting protein [Chthoniobacteraceae bacterium]